MHKDKMWRRELCWHKRLWKTVVNRRSGSGVRQKQTHNRKGIGGRTVQQKFPWNTEGLPKTDLAVKASRSSIDPIWGGISGDILKEAKTHNPSRKKCASHIHRRHGSKWHCLWPPRASVYPWEGGKGPTRSTCTCFKLLVGIVKGSRSALVCQCTLARWQATQAAAHSLTSLQRPGQTNLDPTSFTDAWTPGSASTLAR